jgi:thiamine-monophosphate kinase
MSGEFSAIERIRRLLPDPPAGEVWIGDDAAVLRPPTGPLLLAADVVVEGVHFTAGADLADVGWKAMTANVSDIAAMGGRPLHAVMTIATPDVAGVDRLYEGVAEAVVAYRCALVGGDLSRASEVSVSVAVTGTVDGDLPPVLRSGARAGDAIFVTGALGAMAASGYALRPQARLAEGQAARRAGATAMIDVSDGLAADLGHILDSSGVGATLDALPVAAGATEEQARSGGEDYELVFTGPAELAERLPFAIRIGTCTSDPAVRPAGGGWEHSWP